MRKNMGKYDRLIRAFLAILVGAFYFTGMISGTVAIVLGGFAVIFLATSFIGICPLYLPFHFSTKKDSK